MSFMDILNIILAFLILAVVGLSIAYIYTVYKNKNTDEENENGEKKGKNQKKRLGNTRHGSPGFLYL